MKEKIARSRLVNICKDYGWYMVLWHCHFSRQFVIMKGQHKPNIYSAIFESFYDLTQDDEEVFRFTITQNGWRNVLRRVRAYVKQNHPEKPQKSAADIFLRCARIIMEPQYKPGEKITIVAPDGSSIHQVTIPEEEP